MGRTVYQGAAFADGSSPSLRLGVSIAVADGVITEMADGDIAPAPGDVVIDGGGATIVPGMVDAHSHLTLPGGSHWIARGLDPPERLLDVAEHNACLQHRSGVRWARDVGAPTRVDPRDGARRGLNIGIRDRWRGRPGYPYVRAAGTGSPGPGIYRRTWRRTSPTATACWPPPSGSSRTAPTSSS